MSFIAKHIVGRNERVMYVTRLHWIYTLKGLCWFFVFTALAVPAFWYGLLYSDPAAEFDSPYNFLPSWLLRWQWAVPGVLLLSTGVMVFLVYLFRKMFTEIALTSQRLIYKTGLMFTHVEEAVLNEISAESVYHGMLGRLFDYGRIHLDMRFVEDLTLPAIPRPYRFLRAVHKAKEDIKEPPVPR